MKKLLCFFGIHDWSLTASTYAHTKGEKVYQSGKKCARCGKVKF